MSKQVFRLQIRLLPNNTQTPYNLNLLPYHLILTMANNLPIKTTQLRVSDPDTIKEMVQIYQDAYKNDPIIQLKHILPHFTEKMAETISTRVSNPTCKYILARTTTSNNLVGWLALTSKLETYKNLSEEHVLLAQYALLPDFTIKAKEAGIGSEEMKELAHKLFVAFKQARESRLPDKHGIISTLVVSPAYQNHAVASALLTLATRLSDIFASPLWVPAPANHKHLFLAHQFEEAGEYRLDLMPQHHIPAPDDENNNNKGKSKAKSSFPPLGQSYTWTFLLRQEPLQKPLQAYRSSIAYAEQEAENWTQELAHRKSQERERRAATTKKSSNTKTKQQQRQNAGVADAEAEAEAEEDPALLLLLGGGDIQTATATESASSAKNRNVDEEAGPETALLVETGGARGEREG